MLAKLITKFKYLKPSEKINIGGYAKYIATREGVDKIDDTQKFALATVKQKQLIEKILNDFPDSKEMLEYEDYLGQQTIGTASEFITRALEDNAYEVMSGKTYADYIATRPRAERFGSHGLFTDDGVQVQLSKVSEELNLHGGNVWTAIISLRREDAERLNFNTGTRWRDMLRTQTEALASNLKIPMENLRWFAAFHNESHHPHVHLIAYSKIENEGYLTQKGVANLRSSFAKDIFSQDLQSVYEKKTEFRDTLRQSSREILAKIISQINSGDYDNPKVEELLRHLADRLSKTKGIKVYGYLKADVKTIVDSIVNELADDERIAKLYDLWYEQQEEIRRVYTEAIPKRLPLSQNKEFASVRNTVIQEAISILDERLTFEDENLSDDVYPLDPPAAMEPQELEEPDERHETYAQWTDAYKEARLYWYGNTETEPDHDWAFVLMLAEAEKGNAFALYDIGKMVLDGIGCDKDEAIAQDWFTKAYQGFLNAETQWERNAYIQYRIGKMCAFGYGTEQSYEQAADWFKKAVGQMNPFAAYALGGLRYRGQGVAQDYEKAFELYQMAALDDKRPNAYAMYELGRMCRDGIGTERDEKAASAWFGRAYSMFVYMEKDMPDDKLQYRIGQMSMSGTGTPVDLEAAYLYFMKAAELKNVNALYGLGKLYLNKEFPGNNVGKAVSYLIEASQNGHEFAQYQLGKMFLKGEGVVQNISYGLQWLEKAAKQNNQYAEYLIGREYLKGESLPKNTDMAIAYLSRSAAQGNIFAAYVLGETYLDGRDIPKDIEKALELLTVSANKGFEAAEYVLGKLLCSGDQVPKDITKAIDYLTKAASKGNQFAQYLLGKLYLAGEDVPKDSAQAIYWFSCSVEQGNMYAEYALGKLYLYGRDAEKDYEKTIALLTASAGHGNPYAALLLQNIRNNRNWSYALGSIRLLVQLGRIFQNRLDDEHKGKIGLVDKKLRSQIDEKKAAHGIRQE